MYNGVIQQFCGFVIFIHFVEFEKLGVSYFLNAITMFYVGVIVELIQDYSGGLISIVIVDDRFQFRWFTKKRTSRIF